MSGVFGNQQPHSKHIHAMQDVSAVSAANKKTLLLGGNVSDKPKPTPDEVLFRVVAEYKYKWPSEITSGVLFFEGYRITIHEFKKAARLFK